MTKIHAFAHWPHHERHVRAVWKHIPEIQRGSFVTGYKGRVVRFPQEDVVLVGGAEGIDAVPDNWLIYVEHGAGQSYVGNRFPEHYPGGPHPARVIGHICPNHDVAKSWGGPAFVAGCPALDEVKPLGRQGTKVAITFHWDARKVVPEARSARDHYAEHLHTIVGWLRENDLEVVGTGHPKDLGAYKVWRYLKVPFEPDPDWILERCALVIADNTSLMYEAAALDIPVIALNAPWYRKDVHHGLRFWKWIPGWEFDDAFQLMAINPDDYIMRDPSKQQRWLAAHAVYGKIRRDSGRRAAQWVTELAAQQ